MKHTVLIPFGWYPNGYDREALVEGDEREFGDATDGLKAKGLIAPIEAMADVEAKPVVEPAVEETAVESVVDEPAVEPAEEVEASETETDQPKRRGRSRK